MKFLGKIFDKKVLAFFCFLFVCALSYSAAYTISGYRFEIKGGTREETVRALIVPRNVERFNSVELLKEALERKKQVLVNTRIFFEDEIFYHYDIEPSGGGDNNVFVTYAMTDAKNKFIFPYPKYDSNTGLVLGLRYKDKNFMGLNKNFAISVDTKQYESSYKEGDFYVEIPFECIKIKNVEFSGQFEAELDLHNTFYDYVLLDVKERGLKIGNINISSSALVDYNYYNGDFRRLGYGVNISNIRLGSSGVNISGSSNMLLSWETKSDTYLDGRITVSAIPIGKTRWTNSTYIKLKAKDEKNLDEGLRFYLLQNSLRLNFVEKLSKWSLSETVSGYEKYDGLGDYLLTQFNTSYRFNSKYSLSFVFETKRHTKGGLTNLIPGLRLSVNSKLLKKIPYSFTFGGYLDYRCNDEKFETYFSSSVSSSYGELNYQGNFRLGTRFNIWAEMEYHPWADGKNKSIYKFNVDLTSFPLALSWFNPSVRFKLLASSKKTYWEDNSGWRLGEDDIQQLFRGIKRNNSVVKDAYRSSQLISACNINLVTSLFEFEDFGKTYFNLFLDTGIVRANNIDKKNKRDYKVLAGAGFELIAIMDSHPGYPLRMSLGFNTETLYDKFIADKDDTELEYEIFIGLGFMY